LNLLRNKPLAPSSTVPRRTTLVGSGTGVTERAPEKTNFPDVVGVKVRISFSENGVVVIVAAADDTAVLRNSPFGPQPDPVLGPVHTIVAVPLELVLLMEPVPVRVPNTWVSNGLLAVMDSVTFTFPVGNVKPVESTFNVSVVPIALFKAVTCRSLVC